MFPALLTIILWCYFFLQKVDCFLQCRSPAAVGSVKTLSFSWQLQGETSTCFRRLDSNRTGKKSGMRRKVFVRLKGSHNKHPEPPLVQGEKFNVVLTHTTADFDSLAAAVGLALVWKSEEPNVQSYVCVPRGSHPTVTHFLALHKNLFPMKSLRDIEPGQVHRVGLVDAQRKDRVGPAGELLNTAEEVHVYDHHFDKTSDIAATKMVIERVGSVTTIIVEMLQQAKIKLDDASATLMALGIHSDTGSLTFETATSRDARALAWLMEQGASQAAVSEYGHISLSTVQQAMLKSALGQLQKTVHNGVTVSSALIESEGYINGMAAVAMNILEVTDSDVILLGIKYAQKKGKTPNHMIVIGRAKAKAGKVDLNRLLEPYAGGGHPKAASASFRLDELPHIEPADLQPEQQHMSHEGNDESSSGDPDMSKATPTAESLLSSMVTRVCRDIGRQEKAMDIMTAPVLTCDPAETLDEVGSKLDRYDITSMPVCDKHDTVVMGLISRQMIRKEQAQGHGARPVKSCMSTHFVTADVNHSTAEVEELLVMNDAGTVPVLEGGKLVGLISSTDLLRTHHFYSNLHYHNKAFADDITSENRKMLAALRKKLKRFDID